uniref:Uncharacterized protein n=1 Tax=Cacopsylla melanoneura TaxID=428564 RepID=A0A8D8TEJ6_9HEMI
MKLNFIIFFKKKKTNKKWKFEAISNEGNIDKRGVIRQYSHRILSRKSRVETGEKFSLHQLLIYNVSCFRRTTDSNRRQKLQLSRAISEFQLVSKLCSATQSGI